MTIVMYEGVSEIWGGITCCKTVTTESLQGVWTDVCLFVCLFSSIPVTMNHL